MRTETQIAPSAKAAAVGSRRKPKVAAREQGIARMTLDLPTAQHRRLKIAAIDAGTTMRQLILDLLEREGITNQ